MYGINFSLPGGVPKVQSVPLIVEALRRLGEWRNNNGNGNGAAVPVISPAISDSDIDHFIATAGPDRVWAALDRWTAPELPLVAAE
jgi:hypothetical protein